MRFLSLICGLKITVERKIKIFMYNGVKCAKNNFFHYKYETYLFVCVSQKQSSSGLVIFSSRLCCMQSTYNNTTPLNFTLYYTCCVHSIY